MGSILTEAEEECVHTHGVHAEEAVGDEVGPDDNRLERQTHVSRPPLSDSLILLLFSIRVKRQNHYVRRHY